MAYASQTDIEMAAGGADKLVQLADWDGDGDVDATVIAAAQAYADGLIDSYARRRYATPIASPTSTLVAKAAEECIYWMRERRSIRSEDDRVSHDERIAWLRDLSNGLVRPDEPLPTKSTAVRSAIVDRSTQDVSRDGLKGAW